LDCDWHLLVKATIGGHTFCAARAPQIGDRLLASLWFLDSRVLSRGGGSVNPSDLAINGATRCDPALAAPFGASASTALGRLTGLRCPKCPRSELLICRWLRFVEMMHACRFLLRVAGLLVLPACAGIFASLPAMASTLVGTSLSTLAASMQPGSWAELTPMSNWNSGGILSPTDLGCSSSDYITQYADKAAWDPIDNRLMFVGQAHGNCYGGRFVLYTESTNAWTEGPWMPGVCQSGTASNPCFSHAFGHNTADPVSGDMYFRQAYTLKFFRFHAGAWVSLPAPPMQSSQCCGVLEYFPDMSRAIFIDSDWGVWAYDPAANRWGQLANTNVANATAGLPNLPMASNDSFGVYDPVAKVLLFGETKNLYRMDAKGVITKLSAPPVALGVVNAVTTVDPASGRYVVLSGSSVYQYDPTAGAWGTVATTVPAVLTGLGGIGDGLIAAPIGAYGVIMYVKYDFTQSAVYLYKHSASPIVRPSPPQSVIAN
jgi:hypothetical protein